jgi:hypothetical protein
MCLWKFKISGWAKDVGEYEHEGLILGQNFTEAVDNLENYYYNEIQRLYIEPIGEEGEPYLLNKQYKINEEVME